MKLLILISIACLATLTQVTLAQNDTAPIDTSSNTTTISSNDTADGNLTVSNYVLNITTTSFSNDTDDGNLTVSNFVLNSTAISNNDTAEGNDTVPVVVVDTNSTSADNQTVGENLMNSTIVVNAANSSQPNGSNSSAQPTPNRNVSDSDLAIFGVSSECTKIVKTCYVENSSAEFEQFLYCDAFAASTECVATNVTAGNTTTSCSLPDLKLLKVFSCSPSKMGLNVAPPCKARLTECTTPYVTSAEKMAGVDDELFELKICKTLQAKGCLDQSNNGAVCTANEIAAIADEVVCGGTSGLLSGVLLLAAMLVLTRVM